MEPPKSPSPKRRKISPKPYTPIYPDLSEESHEAADQSEQGNSYHLQQIALLKKELLHEHEKPTSQYKKYHRGVNIIDGVDTALVSESIGMSISGAGLLATIIAAPIAFTLELASLACGLLSVSGRFASRCLSVKAKKHDQIRVLAESKLNSITDHVSVALNDGNIDDK